jgi:hypothetical protein
MRRPNRRRSLGIRLTFTLLGVASTLVLATAIPAHAATTNTDFDGTWTVVDSSDATNTGTLVISSENLTTGTFDGNLTAAGLSQDITSGVVTGNQFTFTDQYPGTIVGENGVQSEYAGTINGNSLTLDATGVQTWHNGRSVASTTSGSGTGTRVDLDLSGTVEAVACGADATSCTSPPQPVPDVTVTATGATTAQATTGADGTYQLQLPPGTYTVQPSADGRTFSPASRSVPLMEDAAGVDFHTCATQSPSADDEADFRLDDATLTSGAAAAPCARPTATAISCQVPADSLTLSSPTVSQFCKVSVTDKGSSPRRHPSGSVTFAVTPSHFASVLAQDVGPSGQLIKPCEELEESNVVGVSECDVVETPIHYVPGSLVKLSMSACFSGTPGKFLPSCTSTN